MSSGLQAQLPRELAVASVARRLLVERYGEELHRDELDTAKLLVSELVNNAVLHGQGQISLHAELDTNRLRVNVMDEGAGFVPQLRAHGFAQLGGQGLHLVDMEASRWGLFEGTTHVWFELERTGPRVGRE